MHQVFKIMVLMIGFISSISIYGTMLRESSDSKGYYPQKTIEFNPSFLGKSKLTQSPESLAAHPKVWPYNYVNILVYRFQFRDKKLNWPEEKIIAAMEETKKYFEKESYGAFTVKWDLSQPIININGNIRDYANQHKWREKRHERIKAIGVDPENPGKDTVVMMAAPEGMLTDQGWKYNSAGAPPNFSIYHHKAGAVAHELGHAVGLKHARAIDAGRRVIGTGDVKKEEQDYGFIHDMMGMGAHDLEALTPVYKNFFKGWITDSDVPLIAKSGTYKIYAFDHGTKTDGNIGIRLRSGNGKHTYWLEYRTTHRSYPSKEGVLISLSEYWLKEQTDKRFYQTIAYLLDMTPSSKSDGWWGDDWIDAHLAIGKSYTDKWGAFKITTLAKGGTEDTASAWIEVKVDILK